MNWDQLKTILWLRWRLTRNQWARGGAVSAVLATLAAIGTVLIGLGGFAGGFFGGLHGLREAPPLAVMGVWLGITLVFLFFWLIGLVNELQRSETIDLQRLMHLPVALGQMFVINYAASHLTLSLIIAAPAMAGLTLGLTISRGPVMLLLAPLALSFIFMVTAWTYCLRGWLSAMMSNPRRRRTIIVGITAGFILLAQGPNLYINLVVRRSHFQPTTGEQRQAADKAMLQKLVSAQKYIPLLWLPVGANNLAEANPLPAIAGTLGGFVIAALGLRRAYRSTVRFYLGENGGTAKAIPAARASSSVGKASRFLELKLPGVPEQAAALGLATFRSLLRAPEVKMAWGSSLLVTLIFGASILSRSPSSMPATVKPFIAAAAALLPVFMLIQFLANQFGFDRDGFRALILCPAERRFILLGKNLACLPVGAILGVLPLAIVSVWLRLTPLAMLAAIIQLATLLLLAGMAGNILSILLPYRIRAGSMKPTKMPPLTIFLMFLCQLLFPIAMAPVFLGPLLEWLWQLLGWPGYVPVNLLVSTSLAAATALVYWQSLKPLGLLLQRRETKILSIVSVEVE